MITKFFDADTSRYSHLVWWFCLLCLKCDINVFPLADQEVVISKNLEHSDGIAVDWIGRNLYWTDMERNFVAVSRLNGTSQKHIIETDIDQPR